MGATPITVMRQIMSETMFITTISGLAGMCFGVATLEGVNKLLLSMGGAGGSLKSQGVFRYSINCPSCYVSNGFVGILPALRAVGV